MSRPLFVSILFDKSLDRPFDYRVPDHLASQIKEGRRVSAPLRKRVLFGTIIGVSDKSHIKNILPIQSIIHEEKGFTEELFALAKWISDYYISPLRIVLITMLPKRVRRNMQEKREKLIIR